MCPSCSRVYAADMFHLIRAGVSGGKGVPATVSENPLVFATVTAPSFGHVHGKRDNGRRCRPHAKEKRCEHGRPTTCFATHEDGDSLLGQPLCWECYDYASHVVWQWWAPELWRRFTIALKRLLADRVGVKEEQLPDYATLQYAKVAEYQLRGLIHFHTLIRLDGPKTDTGFAAAPDWLTADVVSDLVAEAAAAVRFTAPPVFEGDLPRVLAFGAQVDTRPVRTGRRTDDPEQALTAEQVAGYLAKYSTKSATDTVDANGLNPHLRRVEEVATEFAGLAEGAWAHAEIDVPLNDWPYGLLRKWAPSLGFRGALRDQVAPLLGHPRCPPPCPPSRPGTHRRRSARWPLRPGCDRGRPPRGRRGRDDAHRGSVALRRRRLGQRGGGRAGPRRCRPSEGVRPAPCGAEAHEEAVTTGGFE